MRDATSTASASSSLLNFLGLVQLPKHSCSDILITKTKTEVINFCFTHTKTNT